MPDHAPQPVLSGASGPRFLFVDALRGMAALSVLVYHVLSFPEVGGPLIEKLHLGKSYVVLAYGIEIFFVLSGFVIACSLRNTPMNGANIWSFVVRRQVRLDPSYWAIILLTLGWWHFEFSRTHAFPPPGGLDVVLNAAYLHNILRTPFVVGVAWTLCLEVQFYLFFIFLLWCGSRLNRNAPVVPALVAPLLAISGVVSLLLLLFTPPNPISTARFFHLWFFFAWGTLVYWSTQRAIAAHYVRWGAALMVVAMLGAPLLAAGGIKSSPPLLVGLATGGVLWLAGQRNALATWCSHPFWQHFGHISYSLYLTHTLTCSILLFFLRSQTPFSLPVSLVLIVIMALVSWAVALVFYRCIEAPSLKWSKRIKRTGPVAPAETRDANLSPVTPSV